RQGPGGTVTGFSLTRRPRKRPALRTADAWRRLSDSVAGAAQPQPEAEAGHKWAIRPRIRANSFRGTATSANWKRTYLECLTTLPLIVITSPRSVGSAEPRIGLGSPSCRRKLPRLYARANNCNPPALSLNRRHDSLVHFTAFLPSLIHCSAVPLRL